VTLLELVMLLGLVMGVMMASAAGYAWGVRFSMVAGVLLALAGALSVPLVLLALGWILDGIAWLVHGPVAPAHPCARGCSARTFAPRMHEGTLVWCCPCGLSYVLRALSSGIREMRYWSAGQERPFVRRRLWGRWKVIEALRGGPYR
jgi:hypothetical protein